MLQTEVEDREVIEEWLSSRRKQRVHILVPKKGTKEKLVELARENARMVLDKDRERIKREEGRTIGAVHEVEEWLGLKGIVRMEAFDISNISGFESVGSMVVYEKGRPKKSDYRKFRIKSVQGPNDYASMEEVLTRRFTHETSGEFDSFARMPDLLLMDGGRGQVNIALGVLEKLGIRIPEEISLVGCDNLPFARACNPKLTMVSQPTDKIAVAAAGIMLERLEHAGNESGCRTEKLGTTIIHGKSIAQL